MFPILAVTRCLCGKVKRFPTLIQLLLIQSGTNNCQLYFPRVLWLSPIPLPSWLRPLSSDFFTILMISDHVDMHVQPQKHPSAKGHYAFSKASSSPFLSWPCTIPQLLPGFWPMCISVSGPPLYSSVAGWATASPQNPDPVHLLPRIPASPRIPSWHGVFFILYCLQLMPGSALCEGEIASLSNKELIPRWLQPSPWQPTVSLSREYEAILLRSA